MSIYYYCNHFLVSGNLITNLTRRKYGVTAGTWSDLKVKNQNLRRQLCWFPTILANHGKQTYFFMNQPSCNTLANSSIYQWTPCTVNPKKCMSIFFIPPLIQQMVYMSNPYLFGHLSNCHTQTRMACCWKFPSQPRMEHSYLFICPWLLFNSPVHPPYVLERNHHFLYIRRAYLLFFHVFSISFLGTQLKSKAQNW